MPPLTRFEQICCTISPISEADHLALTESITISMCFSWVPISNPICNDFNRHAEYGPLEFEQTFYLPLNQVWADLLHYTAVHAVPVALTESITISRRFPWVPVPNPICNDFNRHAKHGALEFEQSFYALLNQVWADFLHYIAHIGSCACCVNRIHYNINAFSMGARPYPSL